ncbi:MAG: EI24 domain-containing protein [Spirochaetota bacterium]|nr:EI24 domain-containing protein [Spirochaetota bacterium]
MLTFFNAASYPFKGISFLWNNKKLFRYLIIPLLIDAIILAFIIIFIFFQIPDLVDWIKSSLDHWVNVEGVFAKLFKWIVGAIGIIIWFILGFIVLIMIPFFLSFISTIVDPNFRSILFVKTREMNGCPEQKISVMKAIIIALKSILIEIIKLIIYLLFSIFLLFINLIPIIGTLIYPILQFLLTSIFVSWEFLTPYFEEKNLSFSRQFGFVCKHKKIFIAFGIPAGLLTLIPIIQIFFLSTNTIGGALLSISFEEKK